MSPVTRRHGQRALGLVVWLAAVTCIVAGLPFARRASAQAEGAYESPDDRRYREAIEGAVSEFGMGQWQEAIVLFREAHRLRPSPKTHRGLGQALFEARDYVGAIPHLRAALRSRDGTFEPAQRDVLERALAQALGFVGEVSIALRPSDAAVTIDGVAIDNLEDIVLNPGTHTISATAPGHLPTRQTFVVEGGVQQTLRILLVPDSGAVAAAGGGPNVAMPGPGPQAHAATAPSAPPDDRGGSIMPTLGLVGAGLSAVSFGTALVLWRVREDGPVQDWEQGGCETVETLGDACVGARNEADSLKTGIVASAVIGGVLAAAAITLLIVPELTSHTDTTALTCGVGPGAAACQGRF